MPMRNPFRPLFIAASAQKVAIGSTHAESSAINATSCQLVSTVDCHFAIGPSPQTASANDTLLVAKTPITIACRKSDIVSCIQDVGAGSLFITPLS